MSIATLIACIHIGGKGEWDFLLADNLRQNRNDASTLIGSHMFDELKNSANLESILRSYDLKSDFGSIKARESLMLNE